MCCFKKVNQVHINIGLIISLFASEVIFTSMLSMIFHCKKFDLIDLLGIIIFIIGTFLIGLSLKAPSQQVTQELQDAEENPFHDALLYSMALGFTLALSSMLTVAQFHDLSIN